MHRVEVSILDQCVEWLIDELHVACGLVVLDVEAGTRRVSVFYGSLDASVLFTAVDPGAVGVIGNF